MVVIVTMLCVTLSLAISSASLHIHQLQASHELVNGQFDYPTLPRKLMFNSKIADYGAKDLVSSNGKNKESTGESHKEEVKVMMHAAKGTRLEWMEGSDTGHEFFTMDYSHVRRRRPIHNKSFRKTAIINSP